MVPTITNDTQMNTSSSSSPTPTTKKSATSTQRNSRWYILVLVVIIQGAITLYLLFHQYMDGYSNCTKATFYTQQEEKTQQKSSTATLKEETDKTSHLHATKNHPTTTETNEQLVETQNSSSTFFQHDICILTLVRPDGYAARQCQRNYCQRSYYEHNIPHHFIVGIPSYTIKPANRKVQGELGTPKEINVSRAILREHTKYHDIIVSPNRDYYQDIFNKRLLIFQWGVQHKCKYTFKIDDEFCLNIPLVKQLLQQHEQLYPQQELYIGHYKWNGTEHYNVMKGPDGQTGPYMSGNVNGVSYKTAQYIVSEEHWNQVVLTPAYGSSSEDRNVGAIIRQMSKEHNFTVHWLVNKKIKNDSCKEKKKQQQKLPKLIPAATTINKPKIANTAVGGVQ